VRSDRYEWDEEKAAINLAIHRLSFEQAIDVFDDLLCVTFTDHAHSIDEVREVTIGTTFFNEVLVVSHVTRDERIRIITARRATKAERRKYMNKEHDYISDKKELEDDLAPEYDFDYSKGVRGKYYQGRGRLVIHISIDEDVARYFSTTESVNTALRQLIAEGRAPAPRTE
jgi:uncharacterized DUF497 family protein